MLQPNDYPISVKFDAETGIFAPVKTVVERRVSDLKEMFQDKAAVNYEMTHGDKVVYEIRYHPFVTSKSDMSLGVTRIFPGKVGDEYHFTKGHVHERDDQPEIYYCVHGTGYLLLDTMEGDFQAERWEPGVISHIPPMWAHRVVNTGNDLLIFVASYNVKAGHLYEKVEKQGFAQILVEKDGKPTFLPNKK